MDVNKYRGIAEKLENLIKNLRNQKDCQQSKSACTLAETLITLVIVGIIAALTVPALIAKYQEQQTVIKVKRSYSIIAQAFRQAETNMGPVDTWILNNVENTLSVLTPNLNIIKKCKRNESGCWAEKYYTLKGLEAFNKDVISAEYVLSDGTFLRVYKSYSGCTFTQSDVTSNKYLSNVCSELYIDINGLKKPNTYGKDIFAFWLTKYGVYPIGTRDERYWRLNSTCSKNAPNLDNGAGCTAWVIEKGNMDYLHRDISW